MVRGKAPAPLRPCASVASPLRQRQFEPVVFVLELRLCGGGWHPCGRLVALQLVLGTLRRLLTDTTVSLTASVSLMKDRLLADRTARLLTDSWVGGNGQAGQSVSSSWTLSRDPATSVQRPADH